MGEIFQGGNFGVKIIFTRPQHDLTVRYVSSWATEAIFLAQKKKFDVIDLFREKANREELESRIKKLRPEAIFLAGHGDENAICGHDDKILIQNGDNDEVLTGKIIYALSCSSGRILGREISQKRNTAYIGYDDDFIFLSGKSVSKPLADGKAEPFMRSSNQVMISLLKGHTAAEASRRSKEVFEKNRLGLMASDADVDSLEAAKYLWWDSRHQVCLGNLEAKLIQI